MPTSLKFRLEALLVRALIGLVARLPAATASNLGGFVARGIGPWLRVSRVADANLRLAMPDLGAAGRARIIRGVWDNLGRTACEFPHIRHLGHTESGPGIEIVCEPERLAAFRAGGAVIFVSGHMANWEAMMPLLAGAGPRPGVFYRAARNPLVDRLIQTQRGATRIALFAKGATGARAAMLHLRDGGQLGLLADQKMNDGIAATLFGQPAMTASAPAALALRFGCPLVPVRVERLGPARIRVVVEPALAAPASGDRHADVAVLTQMVNDRLEAWIRARPCQWLWLHRRWPKDIMR